MNKRFCSVFLCLTMLISLIPVKSSAQTKTLEQVVSKSVAGTGPAQSAAPEDILISTSDTCLYAQGVALVIKKNGSITSAYDKQGTLLTGDTDLKDFFIFGGSKQSGTATDTSVTMESGTVKCIYGANHGGTMIGDAGVTVLGGSVNAVYGGNVGGTLTGDTSVLINGGVVRTVFGSGNGSDMVHNGSTHVTLQGGTIGWAYGASGEGTLKGTANMTVKNGIKVWGNSYTSEAEPATDAKGTIFGGGWNDTVTATNVVLQGGDYTWAYGGGESYGNQKSSAATTNIRLTAAPEKGWANISGGSLQGEVTTANVEVCNVKQKDWALYIHGSGWDDFVKTANITFKGKCNLSDVEVEAVWGGSTAVVEKANFIFDNVELADSNRSICGPLVGTGVTDKVSVQVLGAAKPEEFFQMQVKDVDSVKIAHSCVALSGFEAQGNPKGKLELKTLEVGDAGEVLMTTSNTDVDIDTLKGNGKITFQTAYDGTQPPVVTVGKIDILPSAPLKMYVTDHSGSADKAGSYFKGAGVTDLESAASILSMVDGYTVVRVDDELKLVENTGSDSRVYTKVTAVFDKSKYTYGSSMRLKVAVKTAENEPVANEQVLIGMGTMNTTIASATLDAAGEAEIVLPINSNVREKSTTERCITAEYIGSAANKRSSALAALETDSTIKTYAVTSAAVSLTKAVSKPVLNGETTQDVTPSADDFYSAQVVWTPGTDTFKEKTIYKAGIRLEAKSGYDFKSIGTVNYLGTTVTPEEQEDGSLLLRNVVTYYPVSVTGGTVDKEYALPGEEVRVTFDESDEDVYFVNWKTVPSVSVIGDTNLNTETMCFTMPERAVSVEAAVERYLLITASAGTGGAISPCGSTRVQKGDDKTFAITPDKGFEVDKLKVDGVEVLPAVSYTFENVTETHTIEVVFKQAEQQAPSGEPVPTAEPSGEPVPTAEPSGEPVPTAEPGGEPVPTAEPGGEATRPAAPTVDPGGEPTSTTPSEPGGVPASTTTPGSEQAPSATAPAAEQKKMPAKVSVRKVRNKKRRKIVVTWKKVKGAKGYQIWCSLNRKFKKAEKITTKKKMCVIKKRKKKTYYVRVRAYRTEDGKKVYGAWSKSKKVKVKK